MSKANKSALRWPLLVAVGCVAALAAASSLCPVPLQSQIADVVRAVFPSGKTAAVLHHDGQCLIANGHVHSCAADEYIGSEAQVHPTLLLHPNPRTVLVVGALGGPLVREALRHYLLVSIVWLVDDEATFVSARERMPSAFKFDDPLSRVRTVHQAADATFDIVLVDQAASTNADVLQQLRQRLAPGGLLSIRSDFDSAAGKTAFVSLERHFKHVHAYAEFVPSTKTQWSFHVATNTDLHANPAVLAPSFVDALIARRVLDGDELDHYDGRTHTHMFAMPGWLRSQMHTLRVRSNLDDKLDRAGSSVRFPVNFAPSQQAAGLVVDDEDTPAVVTVVRDYYGCDGDVLADADALRDAVKEGLEFAHLQVVDVDVYDASELAVKEKRAQLNTASKIDMSVNRARVASKGAKTAAAATVSVVITATLVEGHVTLRTFEGADYASAEATVFSDQVSTDEILGYIGQAVHAKRETGSTLRRGVSLVSPAAHADADATIDHWYHGSDYWMSPKVKVLVSPTAGRGQFAAEDIAEGEVLFRGPVEHYLRHERELRRMPHWRHAFINHMGEQAEEDVWVSPPVYDDDDSYYTNHNCDPNLWYTGYDTMVARRDIPKGQELTFDYATADAEPDSVMKCNCGSPKCRGHVRGNDWQRADLREAYGLSHFWPHIQRYIVRAYGRDLNNTTHHHHHEL
ncbi:putative protein serine/threonine kinase [Sorochytrium milnesiophthora]